MASGNMASLPENAVRICVLSGADVKIRENQLLTLRECEKLLEQAQNEARAASTSYAWNRAGELAARTVLVVCDATVMALKEFRGPAGMLVDKTYGGAKLVVDAFSGNVGVKTGIKLLLSNKTTIAKMTAKGLGKDAAARSISIASSVVQLGLQIWNQIDKAQQGSGGGTGIDSALRTLTSQLQAIRTKIRELEAELATCAQETGPRIV